MSATLTPVELVVGVLCRADGLALPSLADAGLHAAVLTALRRGSPAVAHAGLAGHRPDALTGRRVVGLDDALRELARHGALQWHGSGWQLRSGERKRFLRECLPGLPVETVAALDDVARDWRTVSAARAGGGEAGAGAA